MFELMMMCNIGLVTAAFVWRKSYTAAACMGFVYGMYLTMILMDILKDAA